MIFAPFGFVDMALESCEGGELFDQITRVRHYYSESVRLVLECSVVLCVVLFLFLAERSFIRG